MKLYTDSEGNWRGTQAEAKLDLHMWITEEVPTSKAELLNFLNTYKVGAVYADDVPVEQAPVKSAVSPIDESNLKLAYEQAGLARESLKRVFNKLDALNNNFNDTILEDT